MGKNQAVEKAEYFGDSIGRIAYQGMLEDFYSVDYTGVGCADL